MEQNELEHALHTAWCAIRDARKEANANLKTSAWNSKERDTARLVEAALGRAENELDHAMSLQDPFHGLNPEADEKFYRPDPADKQYHAVMAEITARQRSYKREPR